jgi:site-specific DNA recombinase
MNEGFKCCKNILNKLIKNQVYYGKIRISAIANEEEKIVNGIHKPIVSEDHFFQVQNVIDSIAKWMKPAKTHSANKRFLLRGFLDCPRCGSKLTASSSKGNGGKYFYYHCVHGCKERIKAETMNSAF